MWRPHTMRNTYSCRKRVAKPLACTTWEKSPTSRETPVGLEERFRNCYMAGGAEDDIHVKRCPACPCRFHIGE